MNTYHWIALVVIGTGTFLYGGLWLYCEIERLIEKRKRDRMKW